MSKTPKHLAPVPYFELGPSKPRSLIKMLKTSLAALAACALLAPTASAQQLLNRTVNVGGVTRSYTVFLPVNFNAAENMPAMFFFHGGGGTASVGILECDLRPLANANRFIAVYPQAINSSSGTNSWDCRGDYYGGIDEVGFMWDWINGELGCGASVGARRGRAPLLTSTPADFRILY